MRRIAVVLALAFAMCGVGGAGASRTVKHSHRYQVAARLARGLRGTPLAGYGFAFEAEGHRWNVNPAMVAAIAGTESSFGAQACGVNYFGWNSCNSAAPWSTVRASITYVTRDLRQRYMNRWGKRDVYSIGLTYCGAGCGWRWAYGPHGVLQFMRNRFGSGPGVVYP